MKLAELYRRIESMAPPQRVCAEAGMVSDVVTTARPLGAPRPPPGWYARRTLRRIGLGDEPAALEELATAVRKDQKVVEATLARFGGSDAGEALCGDIPRCCDCAAARLCRYGKDGPRIPQMAEQDRPRERLLAIGGEQLTDAELLAIVLRTGRTGKTALAVARELLYRFGDLRTLLAQGVAALQEVDGIGDAKVAQLKAAAEIGRRAVEKRILSGVKIGDSKSVYDHFREKLRAKKEEHFRALLISSGGRVIREVEISVGSLTASIVEPREAFREAVRESASGIVFVHNHPSGSAQPSPEDMLVTKRLQETGKIVGVKMLDHVIIGESGYTSLADEGLLE